MTTGIRPCYVCKRVLGPKHFITRGSYRTTHICFDCREKVREERLEKQMGRAHIDPKLSNLAASRAISKLRLKYRKEYFELINVEREKLGLPPSKHDKYLGRPPKEIK